MRRVAWLVALAIVGGGLSVLADCGCSQGVEPDCYVTFRSNELIAFSAVFPVEYFILNGVTETPFVLGWLVETSDGFPVQSVAFDDVAGWSESFVWDLTDADGQAVEPGFYRIHVSTTAGVVSADVRLVSCCTPCVACWACCLCTTCPTSGGRCPTPCGEPYLVLDVSSTTSCCAFTIQVWGEAGVP